MESIWGNMETLNSMKEEKDKNGGNDEKVLVETTGNHIYFYSGVFEDSVLQLIKTLQETITKLKTNLFQYGIDKPEVHLHINSGGGSVFDGISAMDNILRLKNEATIITHVEGRCASAATFLSLIGHKRIIHPNSFMLIHQLSSFFFGKYDEFEDKKYNLDSLMALIKDIYKKYADIPEKELDEILKHDIYFDAEKSLKYKLVDEIYE